MATAVFFHAHPDDEAIFTGGTMARLADLGHRCVLVVATNGELGDPAGAPDPDGLGAERRAETRAAAAVLGVEAVEFFGYRDSGVAGDPANTDPGTLWSADVADVGARLARLVADEGAEALVTYDSRGIYGHPDHVAVHLAGRAAAPALPGVALYESTVDREYLHFVETHLVEEAALAGDLGLARSLLGSASVEVVTTIDVLGQLERKRRAMAAHASQIPEGAAALQLGMGQFGAVYGQEWYLRPGPPGLLDTLDP